MKRLLLLTLALCSLSSHSLAQNTIESYDSSTINQLIERIRVHYPALKPHWIKSHLANASISESVIKLINKPAERTLNWEQYRAIFLTEKRINSGKRFYKQHQAIFIEAEQKYNVSRWTILSIMGVETFYGRILGTYPVIDALTTLSIHPESKRYKFFTAQLADFLLLIKQGKVDADAVGSYAGAMGMGQFIPTSIRRWAVDADNNGTIELSQSPKDAIHSIANYLEDHGWHEGALIAKQIRIKSEETIEYQLNDGVEWWLPLANFPIIKTYNRSNLYALAVHSLSQALQKK